MLFSFKMDLSSSMYAYSLWIEIQRLRDYIDKLIEILDKNKLDYPEF